MATPTTTPSRWYGRYGTVRYDDVNHDVKEQEDACQVHNSVCAPSTVRVDATGVALMVRWCNSQQPTTAAGGHDDAMTTNGGNNGDKS